MPITSFDDIKHCLYINLEHRTDRRELIEKEMKKINIPYQRFNAIRHQVGRRGVAMSHIECLKIAKQNNWDHILILEDDVKFENIDLLKTQIDKFLNSGVKWDVLMLSGMNDKPYTQISDYALKVNKCSAASSYIIKRHYYDTLIRNFSESLNQDLQTPGSSIDLNWFKLQQRDNWFLIIPLTVVQRPSRSDIAGGDIGKLAPFFRQYRFKMMHVDDIVKKTYHKIADAINKNKKFTDK